MRAIKLGATDIENVNLLERDPVSGGEPRLQPIRRSGALCPVEGDQFLAVTQDNGLQVIDLAHDSEGPERGTSKPGLAEMALQLSLSQFRRYVPRRRGGAAFEFALVSTEPDAPSRLCRMFPGERSKATPCRRTER